jgi:glycosyltransferase involved in cell wall biosynthesis
LSGHQGSRRRRLNLLFARPVMDRYGVSRIVIELAKAMKSLGHRVYLLCEPNDWCDELLCKSGIESVHAPITPVHKTMANYLRCCRIVSETVKRQRIDVIHSHHRWATFVCALHAKWHRSPLITTYHGIHTGNERLTVWGDHVITVSRESKQHLISHFGLREGRITVIPNGIAEAGEPAPPSGSPLIAHVARLAPEKDQETLLLAMKRVVSRFPECRLAILGEGPLKEQLIKMGGDLGLQGNLQWLGEVADVRPVLASARFSVLSSVTEGLPMAVLESLACGRPVVATSVGAVPEVVENGESGLVVPPRDPEALADAICTLLADPERSAAMGRSGRSRVLQGYGLSSIASATEEIYYRLLARKG